MWITRFLHAATFTLMALASGAAQCQTASQPLETASVSIGAANNLSSSGFVDIYYTDSAGNPVGLPQKHVPIDPKTHEVILKPTKAQGAVGNKVLIEDNNIDHTEYKTMVIKSNTFSVKSPGGVSIPRPDPGIQLPPIKLHDLLNLPIIVVPDPIFGLLERHAIASNFDLLYSSLGGDLYAASIIGDNSFIRLDDETYIDFADGSPFGTIHFIPAINFGVFDFIGIGISGEWVYNPLSGTTTTQVTQYTDFTATSISAIDEPASVLLILGALSALGLMGARRHRRPQTPVDSTCALALNSHRFGAAAPASDIEQGQR